MKLIFRYFFDAVKRFKAAFIIPLMLMLVMAVLSAATPYLFRLFAGNLSEDIAYFAVGIFIFAVYLLAQTFIKMLWNYLLDGFGGKYIKYLSRRLEGALISARLSDIDKSPEILKHILYYDVLSIYSVIAVQLPMAVKSLIVTIAAAAVGFFFGALYAAVILAAFAIGVLLSLASRKMIAAASRRTNVKMKEHSAVSSEFVDNLALAQANSLDGYYAAKTARSVDEFIATAKREDLKTYFWHGVVENYNQLFSIVLSALLALPFAGGSVVNLVFFTMLADIIMTQGMGVQSSLLSIMKTRVCFENADGILALGARKGDRHLQAIDRIEFRGATYSYSVGRNVIDGFECVMQRGDCVRISGANGSGKSTVAKLICGLYAPQKGEILFNGTPCGQFLQDDINRQVLYIGQEEPLLNESVRGYLSVIAGREVGEEEYRRLCAATQFEEGDIRICEEGKNLSPGQRKKIMMMKYLLLKDGASVVILDEAFAGLDCDGRQAFADMLNKDICRADKIYVIIEHADYSICISKVVEMQ